MLVMWKSRFVDFQSYNIEKSAFYLWKNVVFLTNS